MEVTGVLSQTPRSAIQSVRGKSWPQIIWLWICNITALQLQTSNQQISGTLKPYVAFFLGTSVHTGELDDPSIPQGHRESLLEQEAPE